MYQLTRKLIVSFICFLFFIPALSFAESQQGNIDDLKKVYNLYSKGIDEKGDVDFVFKFIENFTGIKKSGETNREKALEAKIFIKKTFDKIKTDEVAEELLNLFGLYYIYAETAALNDQDRLKNFYEKGFYQDRTFFSKGKYYYKILYYYLVSVAPEMNEKLVNTAQILNKGDDSAPDFNKEDMSRLEVIIFSSNDLLGFVKMGEKSQIDSGINFNMIFSEPERNWIKQVAGFYVNTENFFALYSYDWVRANFPQSISTALVSETTALKWKEQSLQNRKRLPLVFSSEDKDEYKTNIDELFTETVKYLKFNNREIDLVVISALKSWLAREIKQGINVEDRLKYQSILKELSVCPSGWIFYNLYELRQKVEKLKDISVNWNTAYADKKDEIFKSEVTPAYYTGKENLKEIFKELNEIFGSSGKNNLYSSSANINYIFHKYKGELNYYYENIFFNWAKDLGKTNVRIPATQVWRDSVEEFRIAFLKNPEVVENHENLLKAYNLFLVELQYNGSILQIMRYQDKFMDLVTENKLGDPVLSKKNNSYDIFHIFADTSMRTPYNSDKAISIAKNSFNLAYAYYRKAAENYGFVYEDKTGALNNNCTEIDDYEREFEFLKKIAEESGKKIDLVLSPDKIELYNKLIAQN